MTCILTDCIAFMFIVFQGEGKCFNKLFLVFKQALVNRTNLSALDISVSAENQTINTCEMERDMGPISELEVGFPQICLCVHETSLW